MSGAFVTFVLLTDLLASAATDDPPPVFDKRSYAIAKKAAEDDKKWFIVKATATWCAPCKEMDKTTWRDEKVVKWIGDNAIAVVFDVDKEGKLAADLDIASMPTMIAFKDGKEFDRVVGYKSPEDFVVWLEGIARGEKSIEAVKKRATGVRGEKGDVRARLDLARGLMQQRQYAEAADEYVWLWEHMLEQDPAMYGVRLSFMANDMKQLAGRDATARARLVALRDNVGKALDEKKVDGDAVVDWVVLNNRILGDTDATLAWYARVKDEPRWRPIVNRVAHDLFDMFIGLKRWADAGNLSADPVGEFDRDIEVMKLGARAAPGGKTGDETRKMLEDAQRHAFHLRAGQNYASLLAAGREALADKVAKKAREADGSPAMLRALVETALQAEQPRAAHAEWLKAAAGGDASLAELGKDIDEALAKKTGKQPDKPESRK